MKHTTILTTLLFLSFGLAAQYTLDWMVDAGNFNKTATMATADSQHNLLIAGHLQSNNIFLRKLDPQGNLLWETENASGEQGLYQKAYWINCDSNDNIYVVGKRYAIASVWEYPDAIVALKYTPDGSLLWKQLIPVSVLIGSQHPGFNVRSEVDADGNLYIASFAANPSGVVFAKIDAVGNLLFTHNSTEYVPRGFRSMRLQGNRLVVAAGSSVSQAAPVYVWNTGGTLIWTAAANGNGTFDVEMDALGNIYTLSYLSNAVSPESGEDISITKFSHDGSVMWQKDYDLAGSVYPSRFILSGNRLSAIGYGPSTPGAYFDWKTFQADVDGNLLWQATYDGTATNDEYPYFIAVKPSGEVVITGKGGPSPDPNNASYLQMVILEYGEDGTPNWIDRPNIYGGWGIACMPDEGDGMYAVSSSNMTAYHYLDDQFTAVRDDEEAMGFQLFPNPFEDVVQVSAVHAELRPELHICDLQGKTMAVFTLSQPLTTLTLPEMKPGVYVCHLISGNRRASLKMIRR